MDCIFCKITKKQVSSDIVYDNEELMVFADINPKAPVHLLVTPKKHIVSVREMADGDADLTGRMILAARNAAEKFGLKVVAENIEDYSQNVTRFLVIGKSNAQKAKKNKTSIVFSVPHKAGALFSALEPIAKNKVNMTKIESRPTRQKQWDYVFFIDIEGHVSDAKTRKTIGELEKRTMFLKILGSYPSE